MAANTTVATAANVPSVYICAHVKAAAKFRHLFFILDKSGKLHSCFPEYSVSKMLQRGSFRLHSKFNVIQNAELCATKSFPMITGCFQLSLGDIEEVFLFAQKHSNLTQTAVLLLKLCQAQRHSTEVDTALADLKAAAKLTDDKAIDDELARIGDSLEVGMGPIKLKPIQAFIGAIRAFKAHHKRKRVRVVHLSATEFLDQLHDPPVAGPADNGTRLKWIFSLVPAPQNFPKLGLRSKHSKKCPRCEAVFKKAKSDEESYVYASTGFSSAAVSAAESDGSASGLASGSMSGSAAAESSGGSAYGSASGSASGSE